MALGMSPKERIAFFKKKQEEEATKISEPKPVPKKIGKLDKFEDKSKVEPKEEVKKVVKKKKKVVKKENNTIDETKSESKEDSEIKKQDKEKSSQINEVEKKSEIVKTEESCLQKADITTGAERVDQGDEPTSLVEENKTKTEEHSLEVRTKDNNTEKKPTEEVKKKKKVVKKKEENAVEKKNITKTIEKKPVAMEDENCKEESIVDEKSIKNDENPKSDEVTSIDASLPVDENTKEPIVTNGEISDNKEPATEIIVEDNKGTESEIVELAETVNEAIVESKPIDEESANNQPDTKENVEESNVVDSTETEIQESGKNLETEELIKTEVEQQPNEGEVEKSDEIVDENTSQVVSPTQEDGSENPKEEEIVPEKSVESENAPNEITSEVSDEVDSKEPVPSQEQTTSQTEDLKDSVPDIESENSPNEVSNEVDSQEPVVSQEETTDQIEDLKDVVPEAEEQKPFVIKKYLPLQDDFYNTLFYFSGMGSLIGESVASGIYVDNSTSKRALSSEFLEEEARKKRAGNEKIEHLVQNARVQATDLTSGLKNLQQLLDSLPTFGDVVDINVMNPNPITPLHGEGPPLSNEELKPVSDIFQEAHQKKANEMKKLEEEKSEAISKTVSDQYATMQTSYEADAKLIPVARKVREAENIYVHKRAEVPQVPKASSLYPNKYSPQIPSNASHPVVRKVAAPVPARTPAPAPVPAQAYKPNAKQQYKLAVEATEKAAAKHGFDSTLSTPVPSSQENRSPLRSLNSTQNNISIATHSPRPSPAKEIVQHKSINYVPQKPLPSVSPIQPSAPSSFMNYNNIQPTIPPANPKLIFQERKPASQATNSQFGVFDPQQTLAKNPPPTEKENAFRSVKPPALTNGVKSSPAVNYLPYHNTPDQKPREVLTAQKPKIYKSGYSSCEEGDLKPWQLSKLRAAEVHMINKKLDRKSQKQPAQEIPNYNKQAKPFAPKAPQQMAPIREPPQQAHHPKSFTRYDAFDNPLTQVAYSDV